MTALALATVPDTDTDTDDLWDILLDWTPGEDT